jgi:hypothetical protein
MTSTAVVLGIAMLGTPEALPDCDCATDAAGSTAISKGIINFIGSPLDPVWYRPTSNRVRTYSIDSKKIYSSAKLFMKKFLACSNLCSRILGSGVTRTIINTPAILGNNNLHFASLSSRV